MEHLVLGIPIFYDGDLVLAGFPKLLVQRQNDPAGSGKVRPPGTSNMKLVWVNKLSQGENQKKTNSCNLSGNCNQTTIETYHQNPADIPNNNSQL